MWKLLLLLPFLLFSQELEVRLPTRSTVKPIYLSRIAHQTDWRYFEDIRDVLQEDLNRGGFFSVVPIHDQLEGALVGNEVRKSTDLAKWKKEGIPYLVALRVVNQTLTAAAYDIEGGASKKYADIPLTGRADEDRRAIHSLSDAIHKDLFGVAGIASLHILYSQRNGAAADRNAEIWISDADGSNAKQLTFDTSYSLTPSFFPYSSKDFFYVSYKDGQSKIYRSSLSQKGGEVMVSLRGSQALPAISKKGNLMAFICDAAGRPDLFVQTLDARGRAMGKARQLYSCPRATQASPTFSPDGKQIAFVSDKDGPPRIYVLDMASPKETKKPHPRLLTKRNRDNTSPAWSPDGKKLAYAATADGVRQIWIYDFETEEETQITTGIEKKENPAWAPDSLHLIYNTESEEECEIYLLNIHNPEPIQISKGPGQKRFPCWEGR